MGKYGHGFPLLLVAASSYLLLPLIEASLKTDHWAILLLSLCSMFLISADEPDHKPYSKRPILFAAIAAFMLHIALDIQKLSYLSGMLLVVYLLADWLRLSRNALLLVVGCGLLMLPVPYSFEQSVGVWLATAEAEIFVTSAQFFDLPLYRYGAQVVSGGVAVTINTNCSGTLLFIPALLGCLVCAALKKAPFRRKAIIMAWALPIAVGVNLLRLVMLLVLNFQAPEDLVATFHDFLGWFIMPVVWILPIAIFLPLQDLALPDMPFNLTRSIGVMLVIAFTIGGYNILHIEKDSRVASFQDVPNYVAGWVGEQTLISAEEEKIISADFLSRKTFHAPSSERQLVLTTIFHEDSNKSQQHSSTICFRALGWLVSPVEFQNDGEDVRIEHLMVRSHAQVQAVTEIVSELPDRAGRLRLQIVENPKVPIEERRATALQFLQQIQTHLGKTS